MQTTRSMCQPADSVFYGLHIFIQRKSIKAKVKMSRIQGNSY